MGQKQNVIGTSERVAIRTILDDYDRTAPPALSDEQNEATTSAKRSVRYRIVKCQHGYRAEVTGPFFSILYMECSFGTKRSRAKANLKIRLANRFGFIGTIQESKRDDADNVGLTMQQVFNRANNEETEELLQCDPRPISMLVTVGSAGQ